jgi:hypothetical protein
MPLSTGSSPVRAAESLGQHCLEILDRRATAKPVSPPSSRVLAGSPPTDLAKVEQMFYISGDAWFGCQSIRLLRHGVSPMVPHTTRSFFPDHQSDLYLTRAVARLHSTPSARDAACAWLAAYGRAHGIGAPEAEAGWKADAAFRLALGGSTQPVSVGQAEGMRA